MRRFKPAVTITSLTPIPRLGVEAVVLELVTPVVAAAITEAIRPPTIGIGSGKACGGQILVSYDLLGLTPWFVPAFVKPEANLGAQVQEAVGRFRKRLAEH